MIVHVYVNEKDTQYIHQILIHVHVHVHVFELKIQSVFC